MPVVLFFIIIILVFGKLLSATGKFWIGNSENAPIELITTLNVGDYVGGSEEIPKYPGSIPALGKTFSFVGYTWLVAHKENGVAYCVTKNCVGSVRPSESYNSTNLDNSDPSFACLNFSITTGIQWLDYVLNVGTGKVFIPSHYQMAGGFSWFNSDSRRIISSPNMDEYMTSTFVYDRTSSNENYKIQIVSISQGAGVIYDEGTHSIDQYGFRPCIAIIY